MARLKLGYKVLILTDERLSSYNDQLVTYHPQEWTFPPEGCGPLTVLANRKAARHMVKNSANYMGRTLVIRRCLYKPAPGNEVWQYLRNRDTIENLESENKNTLILGATRLAKKVLIF